jgi:hypothetical protein
MLALDPYQRLVYEGTSKLGFAVWPSPVISVATVFQSDIELTNVPERTDLGFAQLVFREDSFDPVTRIRRGRFYNRGDAAQPQEWRVQQHPAFKEEVGVARDYDGYLKKQLFGFHIWAARLHLRASHVRVVLGIRDGMSIWRVVGVEQISTGEDLVTLKAQANLGVLPEISEDQIPDIGRTRVLQSIEKLVDTAYRAGPESVVDRCRDVGAAVLGAYFEARQTGAIQKDLGELAKIAAQEKRFMIENAARLLCLLHARVKPNEQIRRNVDGPREEDAALAIECAGTILREVGWAR